MSAFRSAGGRRRRLRQAITRISRPAWLGTLRRTTPVSDRWGYDRGQPIDRYYIDRFLDQHRGDIRGRVLEVKDSMYTDRFGRDVTQRDVLDKDARNPKATIIADLDVCGSIPADVFDCCIVTQTLQYVYDVRCAIGQLQKALRRDGVLLVTVPGISRIDSESECAEYWRFTPAVCTRLFGEVFGDEQVTVEGHGNVLAAIAFVTGMATEELSRVEVNTNDAFFPVVVTVRAVKTG